MAATAIENGAGPAQHAPLRRLHVIVVLTCLLVTFLDGFDVQMLSYMAPAITREWRIDREVFGFIFSVGIAGMLIGMVGQGPLSDRFGRKPLVLACLGIFGLCSLGCAIANSTAMLLIARFIGGIGMGAVIPNVFALSIEIVPARLRSRVVVIVGSGVAIGGLTAGMLSAWLLPMIGWRSFFVIGGVMPLLLLAAAVLILPESPMFLMDRAGRRSGAAREADEHRVLSLVRRGWERLDPPAASAEARGVSALFSPELRRNTLLIWLISAANMVIFYSLLSWLPMILASSGTPENVAALSGAMLNLGAVVGSYPLGWAGDRAGTGKILAMALLSGAGLALAAGVLLGGPLAVFLAICLLLGTATGGGQQLLNAFAGGLYPTAVRATGIGFAGMAGRGGAIVGPALCGFLLAAGLGESRLLALFAIPALIAALACSKLR